MTQAAHGTPADLARPEPTARLAIIVSALAMLVIVLLDLMDGRLGPLYSVGFVLIVVTPPMSVGVRQLFATGVLPSVLLVVSLLLVCLVDPSAIRVGGLEQDAGAFTRLVAATLDHGITLLVGNGIALAIIAWRIVTDPAH